MSIKRPLAIVAGFALAASGLLLGDVAPAAANASSLLIVSAGLSCTGAGYPTISSAVSAAQPGDTIEVCGGVYPETVLVDKSLTILGRAAFGPAESKGKRSTVVNVNGDFVIAPGVSDVTISGFTLEGAGNPTNAQAAIEADGGGSGFTFTDNTIRNNLLGITLQSPDGSMPTTIEGNSFINNSVGGSVVGGTAIDVDAGPVNNTLITNNSFSRDESASIEVGLDGGPVSTGLVISCNTSTKDATFARIATTDNTLISDNTITDAGLANGTSIVDFGSNVGLHIADNSIVGGGMKFSAGIAVTGYTGTPSSATTITNNTISKRPTGILLYDGATGAYVAHNTIKNSSVDGISMQAAGGNVFEHNTVKASGTSDCADDTTGPLTDGTDDIWIDNTGTSGNSTPVGICS